MKYAVYHWECTPEEYIQTFDTLEEASAFVDEYDTDDEWMISEI